jgi:hypothetical protein
MVFNNLYNKSQDLSTLTKPVMSKNNTKFNSPQVIALEEKQVFSTCLFD